MRYLAAALLLAACSGSDADDTNAADFSGEPGRPAAVPTSVPGDDQRVVPTPASPKTFGDWTAVCDNTLVCTMASLAPENAQDMPAAAMTIVRQPGPAGGFELAFGQFGDPAPAPVAVRIDGQTFPATTLTGDAANRIITAIVNGRAMALLGKGNATIATISLSGASATLRWIDAQQGRAGTVTAAVARGGKPAKTVPERPALPVIVAMTSVGQAQKPTAAQIAQMRSKAQCDDDMIARSPDLFAPEAHALGGGKTLVLLPCSAGAYNVSAALFVLDGTTVSPARIDAPSGFDATGADGEGVPSVVNGGWAEGELSSYAKGRGLGDCGMSQTFVWDGTMLRLSEQAEMSECRGNPDLMTEWRARVVRR